VIIKDAVRSAATQQANDVTISAQMNRNDGAGMIEELLKLADMSNKKARNSTPGFLFE
jgi:hypothetical protein